MSIDPDRKAALAQLRARIRALDLTEFQVWLAYVACGGSGDFLSFQAYLYGALASANADWAALKHSVWEAENFGLPGP